MTYVSWAALYEGATDQAYFETVDSACDGRYDYAAWDQALHCSARSCGKIAATSG